MNFISNKILKTLQKPSHNVAVRKCFNDSSRRVISPASLQRSCARLYVINHYYFVKLFNRNRKLVKANSIGID